MADVALDQNATRAAQLSFKKATEGLTPDEEKEFQNLSQQYQKQPQSSDDAISRRLSKS